MAEKDYPEEGEFVLCTVDQIFKTSAFVKLDEYDKTGVLATSEVAPGRIRNIRDYLVPNKRIVCKVLRVDKEKGHIDLSLRRVSLKEKKDVLEKFRKEKDAISVLERIVDKSKIKDIINRIKSEFESISEFFSKAREDTTLFKKLGLEQETEKLLDLIKERTKSKKIIVKRKIEIRTNIDDEQGVSSIKKALDIKKPGLKVTYISSPTYLLTVESKDYKEANRILEEAINEIEEKIEQAGGSIDVEDE